MLQDCVAVPCIPTHDIERARMFYEDVLGLRVLSDDDGGIRFRCGAGGLLLYETEYTGLAKHTLCSFESDDVARDIAELRDRGVRFETYEMTGVSFDDEGVATMDDARGVWFRDVDGNVLGLFQMSHVPAMSANFTYQA